MKVTELEGMAKAAFDSAAAGVAAVYEKNRWDMGAVLIAARKHYPQDIEYGVFCRDVLGFEDRHAHTKLRIITEKFGDKPHMRAVKFSTLWQLHTLPGTQEVKDATLAHFEDVAKSGGKFTAKKAIDYANALTRKAAEEAYEEQRKQEHAKSKAQSERAEKAREQAKEKGEQHRSANEGEQQRRNENYRRQREQREQYKQRQEQHHEQGRKQHRDYHSGGKQQEQQKGNKDYAEGKGMNDITAYVDGLEALGLQQLRGGGVGLPADGPILRAALKAVYRVLAQQAHPDKGGSTERMQEVNTAWEAVENYITPVTDLRKAG